MSEERRKWCIKKLYNTAVEAGVVDMDEGDKANEACKFIRGIHEKCLMGKYLVSI